MESEHKISNRRELPTIGSITGIRGINELWAFFEELLAPLNFERKSTGLSTAEFVGQVSGRDISFKLLHRKRSKYFGTTDHMSRVRTFQGLDMEVTLSTKVRTRANIGTRVGGNGLFRRFLAWWINRLGYRQISNDTPPLQRMDILALDDVWMRQFLADPSTQNILQDLMNEATLLVSWSMKLTPGKMVINRRFSSLEQTSTKSIEEQLKHIASLADVAESKSVSREIKLSRMERLENESPGKRIALSGLYLLFLIIAGTALLLTPFFLILLLR